MFTAKQIQALNDKELRIYEYIMRHKTIIPYMTIRELAQATKTSTTSILRFIKRIGYESFTDFKYVYKMSLQQEIKPKDYDFSEVIDCLKKFNSTFYKDKFSAALEILKTVDNVIFLGVGDSGIIGQYGSRRFTSLGKFALAINDPYLRISNFIKNSVVIVLSISGETEEVVYELQACKSQGGKIIAITTTENCTIARISDVTIPYYLERVKSEGVDITSQMPAIGIIENLARMSIEK